MRWRARRGRRYRVQTSLDGRSFATAARVRPGRATRTRVSLSGQRARFIRLAGAGRTPEAPGREARRSAPVGARRAPPAAAGPDADADSGADGDADSDADSDSDATPHAGSDTDADCRPRRRRRSVRRVGRAVAAPACCRRRCGPSTGTLRYVATTGSDANPGTQSLPWRSITKALTAAVPGDRVLVRAGTYSGTRGRGSECGQRRSGGVRVAAGDRVGADHASRPIRVSGR